MILPTILFLFFNGHSFPFNQLTYPISAKMHREEMQEGRERGERSPANGLIQPFFHHWSGREDWGEGERKDAES